MPTPSTSAQKNSDPHLYVASLEKSDSSDVKNQSSNVALDVEQLQEAFDQFNRLSQNFVNRYQNLEGEVESLAIRLSREVESKQNELLEKERLAQRLQSLLSILPTGVVVLDEQGKVQECNSVAIDLLGRPLLGERWIDIIHRSFAPKLDDGYEISLKDGRRVRLETRSLDYEPGQLIVLTDLTETRNLQDKVNQEKRLSSMGKMMASLAHQVRTPLSSAVLYASNLSRAQLEPQKRKQFQNKLMGCLSHLDRHINDMLQFAKAGGLKKSYVSTTSFTRTLKTHLQNLHPQLEVHILSAQELSLFINQDSILSAVANLVDNAYQSSSRETLKVTLNVMCSPNGLELTVADNGCGMTEEIQSKVLEPFYTTKSGGTGLGLAVVHGVVKAHDGSIDIQSAPNQGTVFNLRFPVTNLPASCEGNIEVSCNE